MSFCIFYFDILKLVGKFDFKIKGSIGLWRIKNKFSFYTVDTY